MTIKETENQIETICRQNEKSCETCPIYDMCMNAKSLEHMYEMYASSRSVG